MLDRREFVANCIAAAVAYPAKSFANSATSKRREPSLVPAAPSRSPNYWCTWAAQNYMFGHRLEAFDPGLLEGDSGVELARKAMSEESLLAEDGWSTTFYPKIRKDLFFLLDDGWQVGGTATFQLDPQKFPSFRGSSTERLEGLNRAIQRAGWRGAALWCRNPPGGAQDSSLEHLCSNAGIRYWKVDIGDPQFNLVRTRNEAKIALMLEHVNGEMPVNGNWKEDGRFGLQPWNSKRIEILKHTDVYRTYDVTSALSVATTLDRVAELLKGANGHPEVHSLLNAEDEVYIAAALGCTMGVMRHPLRGLRPGNDDDLFFNGQRKTKMRMDEVVRAVRWQRIAPAFACGFGQVRCGTEILTDSWTFTKGETWQHELLGCTVRQGAPDRLTRNLDLPEVSAPGEKPFVFAAKFPNGAVAVGAHERTHPGLPWYMPSCDVTLNVGDAPGPYGIFGEFANLTLVFSEPPLQRRFIAQDLAEDDPIDITQLLEIDGTRVHFPGKLLRHVGLRNGTLGDLSSPGSVVAVI